MTGIVPEDEHGAVDDELPTMPPPPRAGGNPLRWAGPPSGRRQPDRPPDRPLEEAVPQEQVPSERALPVPGQAAPPEEAGEAVPVPGAPARRVSRRPVVLTVVAVLVACALLGVGFALAVLVGPRGAAKSNEPAVTALPPAVAAFEGLLATSAQAREASSEAIAGACETAAPGTASRQALVARMAHALDLLSSVMTSAGADRSLVGALPGGPALLSDLSAATNASIRTDQDYGAWLGDLQATGCYGGPTNDLHYKAGAAASVIAERADQRLADAWAPIASAKKAPVWLPSQI